MRCLAMMPLSPERQVDSPQLNRDDCGQSAIQITERTSSLFLMLPLFCCVTSSQWPHLSVPQLLHLQNFCFLPKAL